MSNSSSHSVNSNQVADGAANPPQFYTSLEDKNATRIAHGYPPIHLYPLAPAPPLPHPVPSPSLQPVQSNNDDIEILGVRYAPPPPSQGLLQECAVPADTTICQDALPRAPGPLAGGVSAPPRLVCRWSMTQSTIVVCVSLTYDVERGLLYHYVQSSSMLPSISQSHQRSAPRAPSRRR